MSEEAKKWETVANHWRTIAHNLAQREAEKIKEAELWKHRAHEEAWLHRDDEGLYRLPAWYEDDRQAIKFTPEQIADFEEKFGEK